MINILLKTQLQKKIFGGQKDSWNTADVFVVNSKQEENILDSDIYVSCYDVRVLHAQAPSNRSHRNIPTS